ncbi:MAG: MBL fold metallo-hydrolase [Candidatus Portiera sp.]|nr:MBL fold metallo-hydrolase [Portiera sp.]
MSDFFEIDFLNTGSRQSGDAITLRYSINGKIRIHVTDGGFQDTGNLIIEHINEHYNYPSRIDAIIVTHSDNDHTGGLAKLFDEYEIGELWMLRPWQYAEELIARFPRFTSIDNLKKRMKDIYPNIATLEELAEKNNVAIMEPFQNSKIGYFHVLAPSKEHYLDLVVESDKTPEGTTKSISEEMGQIVNKIKSLIIFAWGVEHFPEDDTSPENNMSVIQYAYLCEKKVLLTGDAGRAALNEAADFAPSTGLELPNSFHCIQVPHHGSRHNVSTEVLNRWLGLVSKVNYEGNLSTAIVSAAKEDKDHPRKAVVRAFNHRRAKVMSTAECSVRNQSPNAPTREGWRPATPLPYPEAQEKL